MLKRIFLRGNSRFFLYMTDVLLFDLGWNPGVQIMDVICVAIIRPTYESRRVDVPADFPPLRAYKTNTNPQGAATFKRAQCDGGGTDASSWRNRIREDRASQRKRAESGRRWGWGGASGANFAQRCSFR